MRSSTINELGSLLTAIGLLVSQAGMHLIGQQLPPKQAYMRYHGPKGKVTSAWKNNRNPKLGCKDWSRLLICLMDYDTKMGLRTSEVPNRLGGA
jgi:hypothetical protein